MPDNGMWGSEEAAYDEPVDLAALRSDDALLDAIARAPLDPGTPLGSAYSADLGADSATERRLAALLLDWRRDIAAEPVPELVSLEQAAVTLDAAVRARRRPRGLAPLAVAAAVLVIGFSVVVLAAHTAQPGNPLFTITKVLYPVHAHSVEASQSANRRLDQTSQLLGAGQTSEARKALEAAKTDVSAVRPEDNAAELQTRQQELQQKLDTTTDPNKYAAGRGGGATSSTTTITTTTSPTTTSESEVPTTSPTTTSGEVKSSAGAGEKVPAWPPRLPGVPAHPGPPPHPGPPGSAGVPGPT